MTQIAIVTFFFLSYILRITSFFSRKTHYIYPYVSKSRLCSCGNTRGATINGARITAIKATRTFGKRIKYFSSKMFLITLILAVVFSVFEISFGRKYIDQCPISPHIPLFLLVHGSVKIVWVACGIVACIEARFFSNSPHIPVLMLINLVIQIGFMLFFFYLVYSG